MGGGAADVLKSRSPDSARFLAQTESMAVDCPADARVITQLVQPMEVIQATEANPTDDRILKCAVAAEADVIQW